MSKSNVLKFCKEEIDHRVNMKLLGNSNRGMKEFAIDLLNTKKADLDKIAEGTYLHKTTLAKLRDGVTQHPRYDTIERIYKYFHLDLEATQTKVNPKFNNKPKK